MSQGPVFVVGSMRSGSTLLRLILDAHPRIAIGEETGFMGAVAATKRIPGWFHGEGWFERIGWSEKELDARLREFYSGMFARHASAEGKQRWGEKTPFHSWHMAQMAEVFPDAVFVGIVRHPGAVVHSLVRKFHYQPGDAATYWDQLNREILRRGLELGGERFVLLRYEDLVEHPEGTLRELVDWLGEPWSDDLLRHGDVHAARGGTRLSAGTTRTRDPITTDLAGRWAEAAGEADRALLGGPVAELAAYLGYDVEQAGTARNLGSGTPEGHRFLLSGDALARRQEQPGAVSLEPTAEAVIVPEASAADLAKRLHQAEAALARLRSRRAVRWANALRRGQRQITGLPVELGGRARQAVRRRR